MLAVACCSLTHAPSWTSDVIIVQIDSAQEDQTLVICCRLLPYVSCWKVLGGMIVEKEAQEDGSGGGGVRGKMRDEG